MFMQSPGLRLSFVGGAIFAIGLVSLLLLPPIIGLLAILVGGFTVWGGFIRTLFAYYGPESRGDDKP